MSSGDRIADRFLRSGRFTNVSKASDIRAWIEEVEKFLKKIREQHVEVNPVKERALGVLIDNNRLLLPRTGPDNNHTAA